MKYPVKVKKVDIDNKLVKTENEETIEYDKLLIATGASPKIPDGLIIDNPENVFTVRNLADVDTIKKRDKRYTTLSIYRWRNDHSEACPGFKKQ